ncbi:hypothetical protein [Vibrio harveyi]|uniref:hypothetical protein n=1 Tax=Vibrio harveyi TaxID=669 RepID=UPI003CED0C34
MKSTKVLIGLVLASSFITQTANATAGLTLASSVKQALEETQFTSKEQVYDALSSLVVTPYRIDGHKFNKRIYYGASTKEACDYRKDGYINFVDLEGGNITNVELDFYLPTHKEMLDQPTSDTHQQITKAAEAANEQCFDVVLAPVVDYGYGDRNLYQPENTRPELATEHLNTIMEAYAANGLVSTLKHYPVSAWTPPEPDYKSQFGKTLKSPEQLHNGYVESAPVSLTDDEWFSDFDMVNEMVEDAIYESDQSKTMVMLSNYAIKEYGFQPYVYTDAPKNDDLLNDFEGLTITDDLYQLVVNKENSLKAFENSDLFIITSYKDLKAFMNFVTDEAFKDPKVLKMIASKQKKVDAFFTE